MQNDTLPTELMLDRHFVLWLHEVTAQGYAKNILIDNAQAQLIELLYKQKATPYEAINRIQKVLTRVAAINGDQSVEDTLHIHAVHDGKFDTASGVKIDLYDPQPEMFRIEDIASGLSKVCRFGAQIAPFYSVAQHSMLVCDMAPGELRLEALMHDASEAYLGDVIKPLKVILGEAYTAIEDRFMHAISLRFGLREYKFGEIKPFDRTALEIEHEHFRKNNSLPWLKTGLAIHEPDVPHQLVAAQFLSYFQHYSQHR